MGRIVRRDRAAFEELYARYARRLGGYLWRMLREPELVEETLDDVMITVWQKADRFDRRSKLSTWLFGIAHNRALKSLERRRRQPAAPLDPLGDELTRLPSPARDPEDTALQRDQLRRLHRALERLSPEHRAVVELTFFEGRSYAEIAEIVGCPVNTVKTRIFHARRQLARSCGAADPGQREARRPRP